MFLKSLEIRGFKSFADKTELEFKKGVTAVVGPNGSGKSNISDAVRWVLGEQSVKTLRGDKMADVIFAGTQFRKPVGLAQVSLVLDNADRELQIDYSDVRITRRLYRSGESEYFINNNKCRLKDIQEIFMDTGIGKEGYSLIGQGKIEAILSGKSEDRRKLLEEAAGIVKFKSRKEEAEKRLEDTEQNLIRINDILSTYENRIEPLRKEMEKAKEFLTLSEKLKNMEVNLIMNSINSLEKKTTEINLKLKDIQSEIDENSKEKEILKNKQKDHDNELEQFDENVNNSKQKYYDIKSENQYILSEVKLFDEKIKNLENNILKYNEEYTVNNNNIDELSKSKQDEEDNLTKLKENLIEIDNKLNIINSELEGLQSDIAKKNNIIDKHKKDFNLSTSVIFNKENEIILLKKDIDILNNRKNKLDDELENKNNKLKINDITKHEVLEEKQKCLDKINNLKINIKDNTIKLSNKRRELTTKEKKSSELNKELHNVEANYNVLKNLNAQYEGYSGAVKKLFKYIDSGELKEIKGKTFIVGEVINVKKDYETAIEIALGATISNIITENEEIAKKLIAFLKKKNLGRATFLPRNIIKGRKINISAHIKEQKGYIGVASELVEYDEIFDSIVNYALGRIVIVDNMDNAVNIAKQLKYSNKIVTLDGEVVNPGGSLTGGSIYRKNLNIFSRKREIEEYAQKFELLRKSNNELKQDIQDLMSQIKQIDDLILNMNDEIHSNNIELTKIDSRIDNINNENNDMSVQIKEIKSELRTTNENLTTIDKDIKALDFELSEQKQIKEEYMSQITNLELQLNATLEKIEEQKNKLTDLKVKKAQLVENINNTNEKIKNIALSINQTRDKSQDLLKEIENSKKSKREYIEKLQINKQKHDDIINSIKIYEERFKEYEIERIKIKEKIKENNEQIDKLTLILDNYEKQMHKQQIYLAKIMAEQENNYSKLNDELKLTYAEAEQFKNDVLDIDRLKSDILEVKNEISKMGLVNVGAIQEYEEVSEKYQFMSTQREDLITSKNEIINIVNEMTDKMRIVFKENFKIMRQYFDETFKELFNGGSADLILSDGDELTAKIDINVQPPGKKLQNINLMSGGEKVLSAIALLFSILKMKPTPFCILDEIEAALDDANVFRYAEFLKKFSSNIQFIVITHRKGTMEASDILYGITMEEKGVSKLVSMDLTKQSY